MGKSFLIKKPKIGYFNLNFVIYSQIVMNFKIVYKDKFFKFPNAPKNVSSTAQKWPLSWNS